MITHQEFVTTWQKSNTRKYFCKSTKISVVAASRKACWLGKKGVPLKSFKTPAVTNKLTPSIIKMLRKLAIAHAPQN